MSLEGKCCWELDRVSELARPDGDKGIWYQKPLFPPPLPATVVVNFDFRSPHPRG